MKTQGLIALAVISLLSLNLSAQEKHCCHMDNTPKKGDVVWSLSLGYNDATSIKALPGALASYEAEALSTTWSDKDLTVGFEFGWFLSDSWRLNLGGGFNFTANPGYGEVLGTIDPNNYNPMDNLGEIPSYRAVANAQTLSYTAHIGLDRYFKTGVDNLMLYVGLYAGGAYCSNQQQYDEVTSMGRSMAETWKLRGSIALGVDYYLTPVLYLGAKIDPVAYTYGIVSYKPQEGLAVLSADNHNISALAAPTLKIGFKF